MVEGPGCRVKAEKLRPRIVGQQVQQVKGSTIQNKEKNKKEGEISFSSLIGKTISEIRTLGKEFFIFFHDFDRCLRIHWLMSGSFRLNQEALDNDWSQNADLANSMHLVLSKDEVVFRKSAYHLYNTQETRDRITAMQDLDICAPMFNPTKATEIIVLQGNRIVSDVLLDQAILPGVGNIIKNEALFDSGINPKTIISELSRAHISHLVTMTRDFSMLFYKCRRDSKALHPHLKIYRKGTCAQCKTKTVTTKLGDDSARLTIYCPSCQDNTLRLPCKNSLLGWMSKATDEWTCEMCTFINASTRSNCEMCLTAKSQRKRKDMEEQIDKVSKKRTLAQTELKQDLKETVSKETDHKPNQVAKKQKTVPPLIPFKPFPENRMTPANTETPHKPTASHSSTATSTDKCTGAAVSTKVLGPPPSCSGHGKKSIFRTVHKVGENKGRVFWSCAQSQGKSCRFFEWADEKFPRCTGHDKVAVLRTVYKEGANNGRKFLACPYGKQKQCGFFQWLDE